MPRSFQELVHWLDEGGGARVLGWAAAIVAVVVLSLVVAWKQFHGPVSESTLIQADLGRQLARGEGFTTLVNFPQAAAWLAERGVRFDPAKPYPELYYAPLYALSIAGVLAVLPDSWERALFAQAPAPPDGFAADYLLLGLNLVFLWVAALQTYFLGARVFAPRVGILASAALLVSVSVWRQTVAVNGTPLMMVLVLGAFQLWARLGARDCAEDEGQGSARAVGFPWWLWFGFGLVCGLLFLANTPPVSFWRSSCVMCGPPRKARGAGRLRFSFWPARFSSLPPGWSAISASPGTRWRLPPSNSPFALPIPPPSPPHSAPRSRPRFRSSAFRSSATRC